MAPSAPCLRDLARRDTDQRWLLGFTNDDLGYCVPEHGFVLDPSAPVLSQAPGDHYEATNAVGVDGWPTVRRELEALLAFRPDGG